MTIKRTPPILGPDGTPVIWGEERRELVSDDAERAELAQQQIADLMNQEFRNAHPLHALNPRLQEAVQTVAARDGLDLSTGPTGRTEFYGKVANELERPDPGMVGELTDWQHKHGFY